MNEPITITTGPALTLEECDELVRQGIHTIRQGILGWAQHNLTQQQMADRWKGLTGKGSQQLVSVHIRALRAEGLLPKKELSQDPEAVRFREARAKAKAEAEQIPESGKCSPATPAEPETPASLATVAFSPTSQAYSHELAPLLDRLQTILHHHRTNDNCSLAEVQAIRRRLHICSGDAEIWEDTLSGAYATDCLASAAVD